jgi:hypothetical protein
MDAKYKVMMTEGLPMPTVAAIIEHAAYVANRRCRRSHDPLAPALRRETWVQSSKARAVELYRAMSFL